MMTTPSPEDKVPKQALEYFVNLSCMCDDIMTELVMCLLEAKRISEQNGMPWNPAVARQAALQRLGDLSEEQLAQILRRLETLAAGPLHRPISPAERPAAHDSRPCFRQQSVTSIELDPYRDPKDFFRRANPDLLLGERFLENIKTSLAIGGCTCNIMASVTSREMSVREIQESLFRGIAYFPRNRVYALIMHMINNQCLLTLGVSHLFFSDDGQLVTRVRMTDAGQGKWQIGQQDVGRENGFTKAAPRDRIFSFAPRN